MARRGDVVENPLTGERVTFLETVGDTGGDLLRFEYALPPGWFVPTHIHPRQEERHEVLSGTLRGRVGGQERDHGEGRMVVGPPGVPHAWRNPSDEEELLLVSELRPALHMEDLLELGPLIMGDLKRDKIGAPKHLLRLAVLTSEAEEDFYFTHRHIQASLTLFGALGSLGRLLGYEASREAVSRSEGQGRLSPEAVGGVALVAALALLVLRRRGRLRTR
ncbi:MAG: cupin domain-containing protein [Actinomycetota bacterium]|nr:cupin domain-containing protein [Actinomycetota bacterium]